MRYIRFRISAGNAVYWLCFWHLVFRHNPISYVNTALSTTEMQNLCFIKKWSLFSPFYLIQAKTSVLSNAEQFEKCHGSNYFFLKQISPCKICDENSFIFIQQLDCISTSNKKRQCEVYKLLFTNQRVQFWM